jgi:hypothetical protein
MCVDCVLASARITQVDLGDEPLSKVVLSQCYSTLMSDEVRCEYHLLT